MIRVDTLDLCFESRLKSSHKLLRIVHFRRIHHDDRANSLLEIGNNCAHAEYFGLATLIYRDLTNSLRSIARIRCKLRDIAREQRITEHNRMITEENIVRSCTELQ